MKTLRNIFIYSALLIVTSEAFVAPAFAQSVSRDVLYTGAEEAVFVTPGEPTQVILPGPVKGGFKTEQGSVGVKIEGSFLYLIASPSLSPEGEPIFVTLADERTYSLRATPTTPGVNTRDSVVRIKDKPQEEDTGAASAADSEEDRPVQRTDFAPPSSVSGLVREMVLMAEFGKQKGIVGYRRSNRYAGEVLLDDGALNAKIDEMYLGGNYWGYVVTVENMLDTAQYLNPAVFRLDGTLAVAAERWELSPRPQTAEQQLARAHQGKIYIVTKAKR